MLYKFNIINWVQFVHKVVYTANWNIDCLKILALVEDARTKVLRYAALLQRNPRPSGEEKAAALAGVPPYFYRDYDVAVRNYPLQKCIQVISILNEYDYKGKGGDGGDIDQGTLLVEMVTKILNI